MKIGVFDSGVGGLHVAKFIEESLPDYEVVLREDKDNLPYGNKPPGKLLKLVLPILSEMVEEGCDVIVVACNTVTTNIINDLRQRISVPLVGIEPMVKPASDLTHNGKIAVCATPATLKSPRYQELKSKYLNKIECIEPDCSDWAMMIENNDINTNKIKSILNMLSNNNVDVIVLGCTHYHWIEEYISTYVDSSVRVLQPEDAVLKQLKVVLRQLS